MRALILNGCVVEVSEVEFPVAEPLIWVDCGKDVKAGYKLDNGTFNAPEPVSKSPYVMLRDIDFKKIRAITDAILTGDNTLLMSLEDEAKKIREEI